MSDRLTRAIARIDETNDEDPRRTVVAGEPRAVERIYGEQMSAWLDRLEPAPSDALRIAVRAQHVARWRIPRGEFPEGTAGYRRWRSELGRMHGGLAAAICREVGYDEASAARVRDLVMKKGAKQDDEAQTVEDVACLVFLEHSLPGFAAKHERTKLVDIVAKTWRKMSPRGQAAASGLALPGELAAVLAEAVSAEPARAAR